MAMAAAKKEATVANISSNNYDGRSKNYCLVKYIHLKDVNPSTLHTTQDFEYSSAVIDHTSYEEMEQKVLEHCPQGFVCFNPITLHHEVLWRTSLRAAGNGLVEVDQLFQPIDNTDYAAIRWNHYYYSPNDDDDHYSNNRENDDDGDCLKLRRRVDAAAAPMLSVCVHIQQQEVNIILE